MDTKTTLLNLTRMERVIINDIIEDEYSNGRGVESTPWSWSVVDGSKARAGVLSSLTKKGIVWTQGTGRDAMCGFTDEGKVVAAEVHADEKPAAGGVTPTDEKPADDKPANGPEFRPTANRFGQLSFGL